MLNSGRIIRLFAGVLRTFLQYLTAFCSRPEAVSDVIYGRFPGMDVPDKFVKYCDPRLNRFAEIRPKPFFELR